MAGVGQFGSQLFYIRACLEQTTGVSLGWRISSVPDVLCDMVLCLPKQSRKFYQKCIFRTQALGKIWPPLDKEIESLLRILSPLVQIGECTVHRRNPFKLQFSPLGIRWGFASVMPIATHKNRVLRNPF